MKIEVKSTPHRKVPVKDILPNPHRDLQANPISPEKIENLIDSISRTGFWDNIVVRPHPTKDGKYQLAYGHNRLEALKDKRVIADTITIPVANLSDWEMYCAMVDENEMQGSVTPAIAFENVEVGCNLIEAALKKIGPRGAFAQFNESIGNFSEVVPIGTTSGGQTFEQVRDAYFRGEGIGRRFLQIYLPCGKMRKDTIAEVTQSRYGSLREKAKAKEAAAARKAAASAEDAAEAARLRKQADDLEAQAAKIGKGTISKDVLLRFRSPNMMTDFGAAVRHLGIPPKYHAAAADEILRRKVYHDRIRIELEAWYDQKTGKYKAPPKPKGVPDVEEFAREIAVAVEMVFSTRAQTKLEQLVQFREHLSEVTRRRLVNALRDQASMADKYADRLAAATTTSRGGQRLLTDSK